MTATLHTLPLTLPIAMERIELAASLLDLPPAHIAEALAQRALTSGDRAAWKCYLQAHAQITTEGNAS